jgi:hypothetical protein
MPPYELQPEYMHFYLTGGTERPLEVALDYLEPEPVMRGWARTYWHWEEDIVASTDRDHIDYQGALALMRKVRGEPLANDEMTSLINRVRNQLPPMPATVGNK